MKMYTRATAAFMMTCGLGLFAAAAPAAAATNEVLDIGNGTLLAKGLGFRISYTYTCRPGFVATSVIDVEQLVSKSRLAVGVAGSTSPTPCTGDPQTTTVVGVIKDDIPLKSGVALARLTVYVDNQVISETLEFREEIRLSNK
ncbi:hypothetical protein JOE31_001357 [Arthrobacter sp. PvP023]|uniref:hypothetical protein n=1 Tax=Micrococcaceae TaxID=1268 RepID=UPI001AE67C64|nr:hypothetical protein [Arthrobacter sp. PvP023]MBP1135125.1 hypothetical protein [Arthrobacter sp. PvP023]